MALEGNVKDFGLSEILQLIALQKKSGMLSITGDTSIVIFFRDGQVISTRDRRNRSRDPLKDYLLRYGFIGRDEMNKIQQIQTETNMDLTEILISEKHFSEDELTTIFVDQIQESIQEVLSWPKSYFKFVNGKHVLQGVKSYASLKVEGMLMESMRRIDEFPELLRIFPSVEIVLARLNMPAENPPQLDCQEEIIYDLLDNEQRISEIVSHATMARYCTYEALKNLLEKGLLEIVEKPEPFEEKIKDPVVKKKRRRKGRIIPTMVAVMLLIACFALGEYIVPAVLPPGWNEKTFDRVSERSVPGSGSLAGDIEELNIRQLEASMKEGLEQYYAVMGSYPFTLEILAVRRFVPQEVISKVHRYGLRYRVTENGTSYFLARN